VTSQILLALDNDGAVACRGADHSEEVDDMTKPMIFTLTPETNASRPTRFKPIKPVNYRVLMVSLLSTTLLTGCVWQTDYDALQAQNQQLQAQNQQLQAQLTASQQQNNRLVGAVKYVANSDLLFASGSWEMRPQGQHIIAGFAQKLAPTQQHHLVVSGYTDNAPIGPALRRKGVNSNEELSQKRADAVMQFLISQGVDPTLISAHGFGEADPIGPNDTPAGRAKNRRVELSLAS